MAPILLIGALQLFLFLGFSVSPEVGHRDRAHYVPKHAATGGRRQAITSPVYSVWGIRGLDSSTMYPRLEIRELERNKDQLNIYLLALQRFQSKDQEDWLSYS